MTDLPTPDVFLLGANCLLCIAVAEANHQKISKHVDTFKTDDLSLVKSDLACVASATLAPHDLIHQEILLLLQGGWLGLVLSVDDPE